MIFVSLLYCWNKGIYTCKYMDDWEKFKEKPLPEKEDFYSHSNI